MKVFHDLQNRRYAWKCNKNSIIIVDFCIRFINSTQNSMELLMFVQNIWPWRKIIIAESIKSPYLDIVKALLGHSKVLVYF